MIPLISPFQLICLSVVLAAIFLPEAAGKIIPNIANNDNKSNNKAFYRSSNPNRNILALVPTHFRNNVKRSTFDARITASNEACSQHSSSYPALQQLQLKKLTKHVTDAQRFVLSTHRGGENSIQSNDGNNGKISKKKILLLAMIPSLMILIVMNKDVISSLNFKEELSNQLEQLSSMGTKGLITYIFAFIIWEMVVGVTTPVETAAGIAFGFKRGVIANAIGKTSGAIFAFLLGRYVFRDNVTKTLKDNEYMDLVKDSITKRPIPVALIWRFSFLPEQIKNFGLAILPVKLYQFIFAVLLHGFPFTLLWTFMGNEMGLLIKGVIDKPTKILKILTGGVYVLGFFVSPSLVGLWIKGLRDEKMKREAKT